LLLGNFAALPAVSCFARAQAYRTRPVRWVVTAAPGGPADTLARLLGSWLSERLGQPFVIENRTGAGGNIGTEAVVRAPADGYTLHLTATSDAINATLTANAIFPTFAPSVRALWGLSGWRGNEKDWAVDGASTKASTHTRARARVMGVA
jgi:tripartite-type tricarboxylate transporter receptor subunit TctC